MRLLETRPFIAGICTATLVLGQTAPQAAAPKAIPKPAAAKPAPSLLDEVIDMVKGGLTDAMVLRQIRKTNKPMDLTPAQMLRLKQAGVSENVMNALMDPGAAVAVPAPPTPVPPTPVPEKEGAAAPVRAVTADYNTDLASLNCVAEPRKRVLAISEFDYGAVKTQIQAIFGTDVDLGKGIMALLTKQLQQDGKYRIVERAKIDEITKELNKGQSSGVKQGTGGKLGKLIGADAILMGTIVTFGRDDKKKTTNYGAGMIPLVGGLSVGKTTNKAVVAIAYRLVDTETGEIIDTAQERGESSRESKSFGIAAAGPKGGAGFGTDMTSSNFAETIIGEATINCIKALAEKMSQQQAKVKMRRIEVEGRVAEVASKNLYITASGSDGVNKCDRFEISKIIKEVKDPQTKEVIDLVVEKVGEMVVTEVRDHMSVGVYNGTALPEVNMAARKVMPPEAPAEPVTPSAAPAPAPAANSTPAKAKS